MLCVAPGQVARWEKRGDWYGYCIFFKSSFLQFAGQLNFLQQYPFFNIQESNLLPLAGEAEYCQLAVHFQQILAEQEQKAPFSDEIIRANFQVVLWLVRRLYENTRATTAAQRAGAVLAAQFQYLVNEHFLTQTTVEEYAHLLNVTPNHLSQTIRDFTGRTAKSLISERRLHEARYLLAYTPNDVAEIAYHLGFVEPTHFSKFFKKETGNTPLAYRKSAGR